MRQDGLLPIGQVARFYGLSHDTLRLYGKRGIVEPVVDPATGYRSYTPEHLPLLDIVVTARAAGASLTRLKQAVDEASLRGYLTLYQEQLSNMEAQLAELEAAREKTRRLLALAQKARFVAEKGPVAAQSDRDLELLRFSVASVVALGAADAPDVWQAEYVEYGWHQGALREEGALVWLEAGDCPEALRGQARERRAIPAGTPTLRLWGTRAQIARELEGRAAADVLVRYEYLVPHQGGDGEFLCTAFLMGRRAGVREGD